MAPRILSVAMQKGGVGKTTVCSNLAGALAGAHGKRVLVVDFDDQCNSTVNLLGGMQEKPTVEDVLRHDLPMAEARRTASYCERLQVVPGSTQLPVWEKDIRSRDWDRFIVAAHETLPSLMPDDVDYVLFDTPPSLGLWMQSALAASHGLVIVGRPDRFSRDGLSRLHQTVRFVRQNVNPALQVAGIVLNAVKGHTNLHSGYLDAYREVFGAKLMDPEIPERQLLQELQGLGHPIEFHPDNSAYPRDLRERFRSLAGQLIERMEGSVSDDSETGAAEAAALSA